MAPHLSGQLNRREDDFALKVTVWHQFRALFLKNLTLQFRSIGTNICQLLTPVIFVLFSGLLQVIVNRILAQNNVVLPGTEAGFFPPDNPGRLQACSYNGSAAPHNAEECRHEILNFYDEFPDWQTYLKDLEQLAKVIPQLKKYSKEIEELAQGLQNLSEISYTTCQEALFDLPLLYVGKSKGVDLDLGNLTGRSVNETSHVNRTGFVGGMMPDSWYYQFSLDFDIDEDTHSGEDVLASDTCPVNDGSYVQLPMFIECENATVLNNKLIDIVRDYNNHANKSSGTHDQYKRNYYVSPLSPEQFRTVMEYIKDIENTHNNTLDKIKPQGGVFLDQFSSTSDDVSLNYTMVANDLVLYSFRLPKHSKVSGFTGKIDVEVHRRNSIVNMISNALFKHLLGNRSSPGADVPIATYIMPLPSQPMPITVDITSILGGLLYPFAASFLIPVFMSSLVKDKFEKHLIMMEQNGLSRLMYWAVSYLFNYLLYVPIAIEIVVISFIFRIRLFTQTDGLLLLLIFFMWGHTVVVLGFFFSTFFNRPRFAIFVGYMIIFASILVAALLETLQVFPSDVTPFFLYMMYPLFTFCRLFQYLNLACLSMQCYGTDILSLQGGGLSLVATALVYLAGSTVLLMILSVYLSFVLPSSYGVRKSPFFPIIGVYKWIKALCGRCGLLHCRNTARELDMTSEVSVELEEVDEDVQAEEDLLRRGFPDDAPVVMHHLRKEYPSSIGKRPYVAVHSVSLVIQRDECFGLLGPNGAGKTTLISVLTGLFEPTSGQARIAGYDISTEIADIHTHMGVCPQFDIQHASLTAEEHLLFYARLKGVKRSREKVVVERALRQVNLYDARKRKSCKLSGGMRRRLSVAMATVGNPDILILDEPTTGLDPASRRQVWEVIETVKEGRSVILTTHAMEEADHLCTRIGIMNFGRLKCLGTQTRLKKKFGTGYQLTFNCASGHVEGVEHYVQTHIPRAVHLETYANSCSYKLEKAALKVSEVFQLLDSVKSQIGILDWGIKMTTLEDVFLNIVKNTVDDRTVQAGFHLPKWLPCHHCARRGNSSSE